MTADETKAGMGGASGANPVDEKEIEAALKTIRFLDEAGNEKPVRVAPSVAPTKMSVMPHEDGMFAPNTPQAPMNAAQSAQTDRAKKEAQALVPSAINLHANEGAPEEIPAVKPAAAPVPAPNAPLAPVKAESESIKEDFAKILAEAKLPERRGPGAPAPSIKPEPTLVRATEAKTPPIQNNGEVRIITPEGSSAPILSRDPAPAEAPALEKSIVGEPSPASVAKPTKTPASKAPSAPAMTTMRSSTETPSEVAPKRPIVPSLRTLKDDLRDLVKIRKMSLIHAAALESDRAKKSGDAGAEASATRMRRRTRLLRFFSVIIVLFVLGSAALFAMFVVQSQHTGNVPPSANYGQSLIFAEQTKTYPLSHDLSAVDMRAQLATARHANDLSLGAMLRIAPTMTAATGDRLATAQEFMSAIAPNAPDALIRSLAGEVFFGFHAEDTNVPIIILPVNSYENAFAGILAWEKTMNDDLSPLFTVTQHVEVDSTGAPVLAQFEDVLLKNFDARALRDAQGNIRLLYSFPSRNYLIITESPYAFFEALARLQAQRRL